MGKKRNYLMSFLGCAVVIHSQAQKNVSMLIFLHYRFRKAVSQVRIKGTGP